MIKKFTGRISLFIGLIITILLLVDCSDKNKTIVIGSKNFTEQIIVGEIIAQLIEGNTDLKVKRKFNLGGTFICFNALKQGEIDLYPEYTGTGLTAILKKDVITDKNKANDIVKKEFKDQFNLIWLEPFGFNNTYTITMRAGQAEKYNITRISDLKIHQNFLKCGFTTEFIERSDGYNGLKAKYKLSFKIRPKELDPGLMYKAVKEKEIDVICGFATDGRIRAYNLLVLNDDKNFFPPYYAAPLIRNEIIEKYPEIESLLKQLSGQISDKEMSEMNYTVDQEGQQAKLVATAFLKKSKLILK